MRPVAPITAADVEFDIDKKVVDTFFVAFTDPYGRLLGRHMAVDHFINDVKVNGSHAPSYLLTLDPLMERADGYDIASPESGFNDLVLRPESAMFRMPWLEHTIGVLCDIMTADGSSVPVSPRRILQRQVQALDAAGLHASIGAEPQITVTEPAADSTSEPTSSAHVDAFLTRVRNALTAVPIPLIGTSACLSPGQFEITTQPDDAAHACDNLVILKSAVKSLASSHGVGVTFMAMPDGVGEGNSCHVSVSLRGKRGNAIMGDRYDDLGLSEVGKAFMAGLLLHARELALLFAPNTNSYRRFTGGMLTPTTITWGQDNRTCAFRVVGVDATLRFENRIPGSDANPYLAVAATLAAGMDGVQRQLHCPEPTLGNAHLAEAQSLPASLSEALEAWESSEWVREAFGRDVQAHYATMARNELAAAQGAADPVAWEHTRYGASA